MGDERSVNARLFNAFRTARASRHPRVARRLLDEIIRVNWPLARLLVGQLRGDDPSGKGKKTRSRLRVIGSESIEWDDCANAGRIAIAKAMEPGAFDPSRGKLPGYLKHKIRYELQCLVVAANVVTTKRDETPATMKYADDGEVFELLVANHAEEEPLDFEEPFAHVEFAPRPPEPRVVDIKISEPLVDARTALELLFDEHCTFARHARCAASALRGRFESIARARGEFVTRDALTRALRERGVRATSLRVSWSPLPVWGFAGVSLQTSARTTSLQKDFHGFRAQSRRFAASPTFRGGGHDEQGHTEATPAGLAEAAE